MQKINLKELKEILPTFYQSKVPLYLWGKPSTGKTESFRQFAKEMAEKLKLRYSETEYGKDIFTMKVITLSQYDAPDLRGMPEVIGEGKDRMTRFFTTEELPREEGQGIIFFDELNLADQSLQAPAYQIINDGRFGDYDFSERFMRVAASNSEDDFCNVNPMSLALLSRFSHVHVDPDASEFRDYFIDQEKDTRVIAYLSQYTEDWFPKEYNEGLLTRKSAPWPRQWDRVSSMIKDMDIIKDKKEIRLITGSCVSPEVAQRFIAFCELAKKIKMDEIIKEPKESLAKIREDENAISLMYSVITELIALWKTSDKKRQLSWAKLIPILECVDVEYATILYKEALKSNRQVPADMESRNEALLNKLSQYIM